VTNGEKNQTALVNSAKKNGGGGTQHRSTQWGTKWLTGTENGTAKKVLTAAAKEGEDQNHCTECSTEIWAEKDGGSGRPWGSKKVKTVFQRIKPRKKKTQTQAAQKERHKHESVGGKNTKRRGAKI